VVSGKTRAMIQENPVSATYKTTFARDNQERLVTFRKIRGYPFYIFSTYSPEDYLASWYRESAIALSLLVVFILASIFLVKSTLKSRARELARLAAVQLSEVWRRQNEELNVALSRVKRLEGTIPICAYCKKIRNEQQSWELLEKYFSDNTDAIFTHGACPDCRREQLRSYKEQKSTPTQE
jgi:branched-subunit amino acid transport protein AzlD